jgi:uncharacterized protein
MCTACAASWRPGTRGAKLQDLGSAVAQFGPQVDAIMDMIAGGSRVPKRILLGSERGELASTQDKENFDARVKDRRKDHAGPNVFRPFVDRLVWMGALPAP